MKRATELKPASPAPGKLRLPDGTQSVRSPWVWRGMFFLSLIALGLCLTLFAGGNHWFGAAWAIVAAGWFAVSMWLWRQNVNYMNMR